MPQPQSSCASSWGQTSVRRCFNLTATGSKEAEVRKENRGLRSDGTPPPHAFKAQPENRPECQVAGINFVMDNNL